MTEPSDPGQRQVRRQRRAVLRPPVGFAYRPYDPLNPASLAADIVRRLIRNAPIPLGSFDAEPFWGNGVYVLYYKGTHPIYERIKGEEQPIYVGLSTADKRKGERPANQPIEEYLDDLVDEDRAKPSLKLFDRLRDHRFSIEQVGAEDARMSINYFTLRYLVTESIFALRAESILKNHYRPVWNDVIDGFGNKDPGGHRRGREEGEVRGEKPFWDTLHPGRWWAKRMADKSISREDLEAKVKTHLEPDAGAGTSAGTD